jgi:hypothetical protein
MNNYMLQALGEMSRHGGNYFGQIHVEGLRQDRLKTAQAEAERIYNRNRADKLEDTASNRVYQEEQAATTREQNIEDRDADYAASLESKKSILEMERKFKQENPKFDKLEKGVNAEGEDVFVKVFSDGSIEETDIGVSYAGDPRMADGKHKDSVRKELNGQLKDIKIQDSKEALDKMVNAYKGKNAISDAAMIFYFMKTLDPASVVRESEFRTVQEARGFMTEYEDSGKRIPAFIGQFMQKMDTGAILLPEQREHMMDETISAYNSKVSTVKNTTGTYETLAEDREWKRETLGLQRWDSFNPVSRGSLFGEEQTSVGKGRNTSKAHPEDITSLMDKYK